MRQSNRNTTPIFKTEDEAFEFLVRQSQNQLLKDQWSKDLNLFKVPIEESKIRDRSILIAFIVGVAILLILLFGALYWFSNNNNSLESMASRMLDESYFALVTDSNTRGVEIPNEDAIIFELQKEILFALEERDYSNVLGLFSTKEKLLQLTMEDKFYYALAISKVEDGNYHKALRILESITSENNNFYNESLWLQGLLYIKIGSLHNSKVALKRLVNSSRYQFENARLLLNEINKDECKINK